MIDGAFEKIIASRGTRATMGSLGVLAVSSSGLQSTRQRQNIFANTSPLNTYPRTFRESMLLKSVVDRGVRAAI
jgi:hypothetical protein